MIGVDISTNPCRRRKKSLQVSSICLLRPVPNGPRSRKPLRPPYISNDPQKKPRRLAISERSLYLSFSSIPCCSNSNRWCVVCGLYIALIEGRIPYSEYQYTRAQRAFTCLTIGGLTFLRIL